MAEIHRFPFVRHLRADATSYVLLHRGSRLRRSGRGSSLWFFPLSDSVAEVPVDDRELTLVIHARTSDYQDLTVQGALTYRAIDPVRLAERVNFTLDPGKGSYLREPLDTLEQSLAQLAQEYAVDYFLHTPIREVLAEGVMQVRRRIEEGLGAAKAIADLGLEIVSVRISSVRPNADLEKAIEAPAREHIKQEADEAAFQRRALAVDKERAIAENELANRIELARREAQLIEREGENERKRQTDLAEAQRIAAQAEAERVRLGGAAEAERIDVVEGAHLAIERDQLAAYRATPPAVLATLAARELAKNITRIDHLNLSPDALGPLLTSLVQAGTERLEGGA